MIGAGNRHWLQCRCGRGRVGATARRHAPLRHLLPSLVKQPYSFPRRDCARVVELSPTTKGGWSADRRPGAAAPGWACRARPGACEAPCVPQRRDARLSALHRGGFRLPVPRFRLRHCLRRTCSEAPRGTGRIAWRAESVPPEIAVTSRSRGTPHLAPPTGPSPETPFDERGKANPTSNTNCSQQIFEM
jgi:hypothetical protein